MNSLHSIRQHLRTVFATALLAVVLPVFSADNKAVEVSKASCSLYELTLPAHWTCEDPIDASGMPPTRGTLLLYAGGGQTKCHMSYQTWKLFDINNLDETERCHIESYILPSGGKIDFSGLKAMIDRRDESLHPGYSKWSKIGQVYMKTSDVENHGLKVNKDGSIEKLHSHDRAIDVLYEGSEYVHHMSITVSEKRYMSDEKFRQAIDNIWKTWKVKK